MSQHTFFTSLPDGTKVEVIAGWDRPLRGFFLTVDRMAPSADEARTVYSNLSRKESHPKSFNPFIIALRKLGITLPKQMVNEILDDAMENRGNKQVLHKVVDGYYERTLLYEEK